MSSSGIVRWGALAAMLGIVLAPILTYLLTTSSGAYLIVGRGISWSTSAAWRG
jgi:hypothetical protein